jgi:hypothetical protein
MEANRQAYPLTSSTMRPHARAQLSFQHSNERDHELSSTLPRGPQTKPVPHTNPMRNSTGMDQLRQLLNKPVPSPPSSNSAYYDDGSDTQQQNSNNDSPQRRLDQRYRDAAVNMRSSPSSHSNNRR